ncbi:hypothetical protein VJI72_04955 [Parvimonas micra]|nr:hypothetical protein [Parvimonas sp. D4]MEB3029140.1 hypothetical protein [Parvimonas micra]MEB3087725.1 hypothetical protein [Parvimonas sp. D4]
MANLVKFFKTNIFNFFNFVLTTLFFNFNNGLIVFKNILLNY